MSTDEIKVCGETIEFGDGNCLMIEEFSDEEKEEMKKMYPQNSMTNKLVKINPGKWVLPEHYGKYAHSIYNFKFRPDDTIIMTHMKCGTMWTHEIVWTMKNNPNLDNTLATDAFFGKLNSHIEVDIHLEDKDLIDMKDQEQYLDKNSTEGVYIQLCNAAKSPRVLTTHLPFMFFQPRMLDRCKVIYVARNPYDMMLSFYHFTKLLGLQHFVGDLDYFIDCFMQGKFFYSPYLKHVKQAWDLRTHPNMHFVFYEDLKRNSEAEIRNLDTFLGTNLTDEQIRNVLFRTSFENMKKIDLSGERKPLFQDIYVEGRVGGFFRKGESGSWKSELSAEQKENISRWIEQNTKDSDIKFKFN